MVVVKEKYLNNALNTKECRQYIIEIKNGEWRKPSPNSPARQDRMIPYEKVDFISFSHFNRNVGEDHVTKLYKFISEEGYTGPSIMVCLIIDQNGKEQLLLMDGQHRTRASQMLQIDIPATILDCRDLSTRQFVDLMRDHNSRSNPWKPEQHIHSYMQIEGSKYDDYRNLHKDMQEYTFSGKSSPEKLVSFMMPADRKFRKKNKSTDYIASGDMVLPRRKEALKVLDFCKELNDIIYVELDKTFTWRMVEAVFFVMDHADNNKKKFSKKKFTENVVDSLADLDEKNLKLDDYKTIFLLAAGF